MQPFFRRHINLILSVLAVVFLVAIVGAFVWGVGYLLSESQTANQGGSAGDQVVGFDLQAASQIDYRGLLQPPAAAPTPPAAASDTTP
ncbi:MAG TPA: hypothetical protein VMT81_03510 [Candidatus Paceibacterota bacterium]|nr:hypothetical protein [Candidatus Paceibacterota bacterium]